MRLVLDACVLYPTVMRESLIGAARLGLYTPLWSDRILEEWRRAIARDGGIGAEIVAGEIALLNDAFPDASIGADPDIEARLHLPDDNDRHVLATAIAGRADGILTLNARDFPLRALAPHGIARRDPDLFLTDAVLSYSSEVEGLASGIYASAMESGYDGTRRALFKRARLPRFAKALEKAAQVSGR